MALPDFTMRQLLEAGVHFGHQTHRWNPRMKPYIYGDRSGIHIMDLSKTVPALHQALLFVRDTVAKGGRVLFVGTKRQAQEPVAEAAQRCAQYYMNHRWLGGTLTNWSTVSNSIKQLRELNAMFESGGGSGLTKKELLDLERRREKLQKSLGGIADMGGLPSAMIVIDTNKEAIAVQEAPQAGYPRSWLSSIRTATRPMPTTASRAMTTLRAPSRSTATCSPMPSSMVWQNPPPASAWTWASWKMLQALWMATLLQQTKRLTKPAHKTRRYNRD
jgi:ribosomal protein S2